MYFIPSCATLAVNSASNVLTCACKHTHTRHTCILYGMLAVRRRASTSMPKRLILCTHTLTRTHARSNTVAHTLERWGNAQQHSATAPPHPHQHISLLHASPDALARTRPHNDSLFAFFGRYRATPYCTNDGNDSIYGISSRNINHII